MTSRFSHLIASIRVALGYWLLRRALDVFPEDSLERDSMILWIERELK